MNISEAIRGPLYDEARWSQSIFANGAAGMKLALTSYQRFCCLGRRIHRILSSILSSHLAALHSAEKGPIQNVKRRRVFNVGERFIEEFG